MVLYIFTFMVLCIFNSLLHFLPFSELSLVGFDLDLVN